MSETKAVPLEIGVDWDNGVVLIQTAVEHEGATVPIKVAMPCQVFVEAGVSIGMQMVQRIQEAQKEASRSGLVLASAADLKRLN